MHKILLPLRGLKITIVGLIRFAIIFFLVYFLISLFTRYVLPFVVRLLFHRMSNRVKRDYERQMREKRKKDREGEITIRYKPGSEKRINPENGEYIDYEELGEED
jgi:hypothetical protein